MIRSMSFIIGLVVLSACVHLGPTHCQAQPKETVAEAQGDEVATLLGLDVTEKRQGFVEVIAVHPEGPSAKLDLRKGDIVLSLNDQPITSREALSAMLEKIVTGDKVALKILRKKRQLSVVLLAPERPRLAEVKTDPKRREVGILGMFLVQGGRGRVMVSNVSPETPAAVAGLKKDDVVVRFDGHKVTTLTDLLEFSTKLVDRRKPGDEVEILVVREDQEQPFLIILPERLGAAPNESGSPVSIDDAENVFCMAVREGAAGKVVVLEVMEKSPAAVAGIEPGDVIDSIGANKIRSIADLADAIKLYETGDVAEFGLLRGEELHLTEVTMAPCEFVREPIAVVPAGDELDRISAQIEILRAQIEEMRRTLESLDLMVDALRTR